MLRTQRYKYTVGPRGIALYDLENDPNEDRNLATDPAHADTLRRMHQRLREIANADGDPLVGRWTDEPGPAIRP